MKKLYFLLLLCSGLALAQPDINQNPAPLAQCDTDGDGFATFDLTTVVPAILNGINPSSVTVTFHVSQADADAGVYAINPQTSFTNTTPNGQMVYARVQENANPTSFSIAYLNLVVNTVPTATISTPQNIVCLGNPASFTLAASGGSLPYVFFYAVNGGAPIAVTTSGSNSVSITLPSSTIGTYTITLVSVSSPQTGCSSSTNESVDIQIVPNAVAYAASDLVVSESPNDGYATFDLTQNDSVVSGNASGVLVSYFTSESDAQNNSGAIANPSLFNNTTNPQTVWARVQSGASSCFDVTSFHVAVIDVDVVYIPDANFKAAVIAAGIDTNADGEIQFSEAASPSVVTFNMDGLGIADFTGIKSFTNLQHLYASGNQLTVLDLSGMTNLQLVYLSNNALASINLNGATSLEDLVLDQNQLTELTLQNMPNLDRFSIMYNNVTGLFLSNLPLLREINVYGNALTSLDVNAFPSLQILSAAGNQIVSLSMNAAPNLKTVDVSSNNISDINASGLSNLETLYFNYNPVQSHAWAGLTHLKHLQFSNTQISTLDLPASATLLTLACTNNGISALDVSLYPSLTSLDCRNNALSALDVTALPNLVFLFCQNNAIASLDLNANTNLDSVALFGNGMQTLFAKNGANETFDAADFIENDFVYICADENQVAFIQGLVGSGAQVNSYCSFTPGGLYNTITGTVKFDAAGNGCDASDSAHPFIKMHMDDGVQGVDVFTNDQAVYNFYVGDGNYTVNPVFENNYFTVSPSAANVDFSIVDGSVSNNNFCLTANGVSPDAEIVVSPVVPARPGFDAVYKITVRNKGNQVLSQSYGIKLFYDENALDFVSATQAPALASAGSLSWNYANLEPFESRSIDVTLSVNAPTDTPAVNIGDALVFTGNINVPGDVSVADNTFVFNETVVGSFDPNDKRCLEGHIVSPMLIGDYLHYMISFENTGNAPAENIVIKDVIDPTMFDRASLEILGSTHPVVAKSGGDGTIFIFQSINLDSGGHGNILLKVRSLDSLHEGSTVSNKADIFFDYNFAIETNTANTTYQSLLAENPSDISIGISPNPTANAFSVKASSKILSLELFDVQGRLIQVKMTDENEAKFDISDRQTGVYFVKVTTEKGVKVEKIVKR